MTTQTGAASAVPLVSTPSASEREHRFFMGMAVVIALIVLVGFGPTYFLRGVFRSDPLQPVFHLHGFVFSMWVVFFVLQTALVFTRRTPVHRRLGVAGGVWAVVMLVVGYMAAVASARRGFSPPGAPPPLVFFVIPITDLAVFSVFVATGLYFRRQSPVHKRLMLMATLSILTAAIARLPYVLPFGPLAFFGLTDLLVVACVVGDRIVRGRVHPAFVWGGLFLVASQAGRLVVGGTDAWMAFATWATR
jgi:hypothetical protein